MLIIGQDPFITQTSQGHSPQSKIDFPYHKILGPDICSLICDLIPPNLVKVRYHTVYSSHDNSSQLSCQNFAQRHASIFTKI